MNAKPLSWYLDRVLEPEPGDSIKCAYRECDKTFPFLRAKKLREYCDEQCRARERRERNRIVFEPRTCAVCGKEFTPTQGNQVACPGICRLERKRLRDRKNEIVDFSKTPEEIVEESARAERVAIEQAKLREALKERTALEIISDTIQTCVTALPPVSHIPALPRARKKFRDEEAVLLLSDVQLGLKVDPDEMGGIGGYDYQTFKTYLANLTKSIAEIRDIHSAAYNIPTLNIWMLGDIVEGTQIYRGQAHHLEMTVVEQAFEGAELLGMFIAQMQEIFPKVKVSGVVGNHGRVGRKGEEKRYVNWDYVLYRAMELMLKDQPGVTCEFPITFWKTEQVKGHEFLCIHGDNIRAWMGVSWYGIQRAAANFREVLLSIDKRFKYICLGHFHSTGEIESSYGEKLINGSWCGATPFSVEQLFQSSQPHQIFFGVNENRGISWRYWMNLKG